MSVVRVLAMVAVASTLACGDSPSEPEEPEPPVNSFEDPALAGETLEVTTGGIFSNDATIRLTLLSTVRGDAALDTVLAANQFNDPPPAGWEYLLVGFQVEVLSQPPGSDAYRAAWLDFELVRSDGFIYDRDIAGAACCLDNDLDREGLPGAAWDGWVSFFVEEGETDARVVYERGRDGETWFLVP